MLLLSIAITAGCLSKENVASTPTTSTDGSPPGVDMGAATPTPTTGQEKINTAGILISLAGKEFYQAEEWKLNTLFIDPKNPGRGTLLVQMKDLEHLQPFRIANTEYSNLRFEKHKKDNNGFIAHLKIDGKTPQGNKEPYIYIQVWDKPPVKNKAGEIANGAIVLDSTNSGFSKLPLDNAVLKIEIS